MGNIASVIIFALIITLLLNVKIGRKTGSAWLSNIVQGAK
jgi:hypothetical protein